MRWAKLLRWTLMIGGLAILAATVLFFAAPSPSRIDPSYQQLPGFGTYPTPAASIAPPMSEDEIVALALASPNFREDAMGRLSAAGQARLRAGLASLAGMSGDSFAAIEAATAAFQHLPIRYNRPRHLAYGKSNPLVLSIASADVAAAERSVGAGTGPMVKATAAMSSEVVASLDGPEDQVTIELVGSPDKHRSAKGLASIANATWVWQVTPKTLDDLTLTLSIHNVVTVEGREVQIDGPAYTDTFVVQSTWWDWLAAKLGKVGGGIVVILGAVSALVTIWLGYLQIRKELKRKPAAPRPRRKAQPPKDDPPEDDPAA